MRYAALISGLLVAAICGRLGVWQLDRLGQRRERNSLLESRLALPPANLDGSVFGDTLQFRRASASGVFDFERQIVVVARSYQGIPGVHVVTPLRIDNGSAVLVERGWAPSPDGRTIDVDRYSEPDSANVEGMLLAADADSRMAPGDSWPLHVTAARPAQLAARFPYTLLPVVLRRTSEPTSPELRSVPPPDLTNGPHLSYAVQWFTFATIALVGGAILSFKSHP